MIVKEKIKKNQFFVIFILGIGLLYLRQQKYNEFTIDSMILMKNFSKEMKNYLKIMLISFSYHWSENASKVRK